MQIVRLIDLRITFLRNEIAELEKMLGNAPNGNIRVCVNGKYSKWLVYYPYDKKAGKKEHREYLKKSEKELAKILWQKKEWQDQLGIYGCELRILEVASKALNKLTARNSEVIKRRMNLATRQDMEIFARHDEWQKESYEKNSYHPESLTAKCPDGQMMRSKSEVFIAMALSSHDIPYRYECAIDLNGYRRYPDFMIKRPVDGKIIIWEHFGLWDDAEYRADALSKLDQYTRAGYIPGENLIFTFETKESQFSPAMAEDVINMYLT